MPTDLDALIERLRGATGPSRELDEAIMAMVFARDERYIGVTDEYYKPVLSSVWIDPATDNWVSTSAFEFTGSLDRAIAFCERVLPGWRVRWQSDGDGTHEAFVENKGDFNAIEARHTRSFAPTAALALCLATITALKAQEDGRRG